MYDREAQNARAQQTRNLNAARLNAQQQSALGGYDPAMASRAMFEQTAGAHEANQGIENALAQYGLQSAEKQQALSKEMIDMLRNSGYDEQADQVLRNFAGNAVGDWTRTPEYERAYETAKSENEFLNNLRNQGGGFGSDYAEKQLQATSAQQTMDDVSLNNANAKSLAASVASGSKEFSKLTPNEKRGVLADGDYGDAIKAKLPNFTNGATHREIPTAGDLVMINGNPVELTSVAFSGKYIYLTGKNILTGEQIKGADTYFKFSAATDSAATDSAATDKTKPLSF
jgi:hypothetical protein